MAENHDRRRFLQTSLAAGTGLSLASGSISQADVLMSVPAAVTEANPPARPGRVHWHADFAAACAAAGRSNKPVLLFHMLGRLDQKFC